jgi:hypothetical protein
MWTQEVDAQLDRQRVVVKRADTESSGPTQNRLDSFPAGLVRPVDGDPLMPPIRARFK